MGTIIVLLGLVTLITLAIIITVAVHKRAYTVGNLLAALALFLARSTFIYMVNPIENQAVRDNVDIINIIRASQVWLLVYVLLSSLVVMVVNILVPFIHKNFYIQRTPPGQPDKVVSITKERRSA